MFYLYLRLRDVFTGIQFQRTSGLRDRGREGLTVLWGQRGLQLCPEASAPHPQGQDMPVPTQPTQVPHLLKPHHCADAVGRGGGGGHTELDAKNTGNLGRLADLLEV